MIQQPAVKSDMLGWHEKWYRSDRVAAGFAHGFALLEIWSGSWQSCGGDRMDRSQGIRYFVRARATHKQASTQADNWTIDRLSAPWKGGSAKKIISSDATNCSTITVYIPLNICET